MMARPQPSRIGALVRVGVVVTALLVAVGAATVLQPVDPTSARPTSDRVPLTTASLACPASLGGKEGKPTTEVSAISAPSDPNKVARPDGAGSLTVGRLGAKEPAATVEELQQAARVEVREPKVPPMVALAEGSLAPGVSAGALTRSTSGDLRGLAETPCVAPGSDFWFVGAGSERGRQGTLYLTNVEDSEARVNVRLWDKEGQLESEQTRGIDVEGNGQVTLELDELAPLSDRVAIQVEAERGRVAAGLLDNRLEDGTSAGVDWIPSSVGPATTLVVPGIAPGKGERVLTVAAPGDSTAAVDLTLLGNNGAFQPVDHNRMEVPAGTVAELDLSEVTSEQASAVRLDSDVPVTASVRNEFEGESTRDFAYAPAMNAFESVAVVPSTPGDKDQEATLILSNADRKRDANAEVTVVDSGGTAQDPESVQITPGATKAVPLPDSLQDYTVVVEPQDGARLYGARLLTEGTMGSIWPLEAVRTTALRPVVELDPAAGAS